jgi:hypothetical protein
MTCIDRVEIPLAERVAGSAAARADASRQVTFEAAARDYIEAHRHGWRNQKHALQWETTLTQYVYPKIGRLLVSDIETSHVVDVLKPIWNSKPELRQPGACYANRNRAEISRC